MNDNPENSTRELGSFFTVDHYGDINTRLGKLEGNAKHLATKKEVSNLEARALRVIIGVGIAAVGSIIGYIAYFLKPILDGIVDKL